MRTILAAIVLGTSATTSVAAHQADTPDYTVEDAWLCLPDRLDPCASDQTVTVVRANGATSHQPLIPDADPKFDCFYVYPTVSLDETANSDMIAGPEERRVVHAQAARYRQHCRVFAPLYRQVTITALRALMMGQPMAADRALAFGDVRSAWATYLAEHNNGRGVLLIGHSQGSGMLSRLLSDMDSPGERDQIIAAHLIGTNVARSVTDSTSGDFPWMPVCTHADQAGCLVSYVTFRRDVPPPAGSRFGHTGNAGQHVVCVNPAGLLGHAESTHAIFSTEGVGTSSKPMTEWVAGQPLPTTSFTSAPGLIAAECVSHGGYDYLAIDVLGDPDDPRVDDITGDVVVGDTRLDDWGLHLIDMPVVMGDLVDLSARQYAVWQAERD